MSSAEPQRQLSLLQTCAIIVGTVIGSGVFISLPIIASIAGSPGMYILIWLLGGVVWIPQILVLAEMGTAYPMQGGPYFYLQRAGSPFLAFLYTWAAFLTSDTPTLTIVSLSAISALAVFSGIFQDPAVSRLLAALLIAALTALHLRSVRTGGNAQVVLTAAKLLPLLSIVVIGLFALSSDVLTTGGTAQVGARGVMGLLAAGVSSTLWSYAGFTNILYMAGEVRNPARTLPRALIGSLVFVMAAYTLIAACTTAIIPFGDIAAARGTFVNPFAHVAAFSGAAGPIFALASFVSMVGGLSACIMAQPRLEYAIARDGLFFPIFARLHPVYGTPHASILIQSGLAVVLFALGNIEDLLGYFTLSYALQNALLYGAIFFLRPRADYAPSYRVPVWRAMAGLAVLIQMAVAVGTFLAFPTGGLLACLGLILTGLPVYYYYYSRSRPPSGGAPFSQSSAAS